MRSADGRPLLSVILPAYNEVAVLERNVLRVCQYLAGLEPEYAWEVVIVDDGSTDGTAEAADRCASGCTHVRVLHHFANCGVGQAFRFGVANSRGDYVVLLDTDLSYSPDHIGRMLERMRATGAKIVMTSPYMPGGRVSNVPWLRRQLSRSANRFLRAASGRRFSTLTSMVRAYDGPFLRSLPLRSTGMDVMPEVIHKATILGARIEEIPAHLDWGTAARARTGRQSAARIAGHTAATIFSGFLLRPVAFFVSPGLALLAFAAYVNAWMLIHFADSYASLDASRGVFVRASAAVSAAYLQSPHTFIIGITSLMLAVQLIGLGILARQSTSYFEELFHLAVREHDAARRAAGRRDAEGDDRRARGSGEAPGQDS